MFNKIVFTSDLLKVDDRLRRKFNNPQAVNVAWLESVFSGILSRSLGVERIESLIGDESISGSIRSNVYGKLGLPLISESWAKVYEGRFGYELIKSELDGYYEDSLVVSFEAPPYLIKYFDEVGVTYIDFSIHPLRFLPDYIFGVRTNNRDWKGRLKDYIVPDSVCYDYARISQSRTKRIMYNNDKFLDDSAIFFGQISIDSSLIDSGGIANLDLVRYALMELSGVHERVYYKAHPHADNMDELKKLVRSIKGCEWVEINAYDALGYEKFYTVAALSSGVLQEAKYFNKKNIKRYLSNTSHFDSDFEGESYVPIKNHCLYQHFWDVIFNDGLVDSTMGFQVDTPMKFMINRRWGR